MKKISKHKVLVQYKDIMFLLAINETLPNSVIQKMTEVKNASEDEYITFDNEDEINYFLSQEFILDYNEYALMNIEQIKYNIDETKKKIATTVDRYSQMMKYDRLKSNMVLNDYEKLKYKLSSLAIVYSEKETDSLLNKNIVKEKTPQKITPFWKTKI